MTTAFRFRLSASALAAASSFIALSAPVQAQTVCTGLTATTFSCLNGTATTVTGTFDGTASVDTTVADGLKITDTANLLGSASGTVTSAAAAPASALTVSTTGDLTLGGVSGSYLNVANTGTGAGATLTSGGAITSTRLGTLTTVNGYGVLAQGATGANLTTGAVLATALDTTPITLAASPVLNSVTGLTTPVPVGAGAVAIADTGNAAITASSVTVTGSASPLIGILAYAPAGSASAAVTGNVAVTKTAAGNVIGAAALGSTGASVNVGGTTVVTGTDEATGLAAVTTTGTALVTATGNVTVSASDATGIRASGDTVTVAAGNATITATDLDTGGTNATGVEAVAVNGLTVTTGNIVSSGVGVLAASTSSTGSATAPVSVSVGSVQAGTTGILALADGATPITVTATGPVTITRAAGGIGILASGANGAVTVNEAGVSGVAGGVLAAASCTGSATVNATGGTTTATGGNAIGAFAAGGSTTVSVASGATVTGQGNYNAITVVSGTGTGMTNTVNIAGTVNVAPTGTGAALLAAGGPTTVNLNAGAAIGGPIVLGSANDTINVNSGVVLTPTAIDFGTGTDTLNVNSGGTLNLSATPGYTGLEVLNNAGTLGLTGDVSLAGLTFTNTGTIRSTGAASLSGLTTYSNAGTISMVNGVPTDTLTLNGDYVGVAPNARLAVDVNGALTSADRLVVTGNSSGATVIDVNLLGGAVYNPTGVTVVSTGGTVGAGAFTLNPADVAQGYLNLAVVQSGGATKVVSQLDASVTDLGLVSTFGRDLWYQSFDAYDDAVRGRHAGSLATGQRIGIWGQLYASRDRMGHAGQTFTANGNTLSYSTQLKTERKGAQVGLEYRGPGFVLGVTGGYEKADSRDHPVDAQLTADGRNWGVYGLVGMANGLYAGLLYKRDEHDIRYRNTGRGTYASFNDAHTDGIDGEIGLKGDLGAVGFDVQAGLSYVKTTVGGYSAQGLDFGWDDNKSVRGRLGGRVVFPSAWGAFLGAKVYHEFRDDGTFRVFSNGVDVAEIGMPHRGTWVRLEGGLDSFGIKGLLLNVWGDVGDTKSIGARVGFRF